MNNFELKMKLKEAYPDLKKDIITEIMATTEFINTDVQTFIDRSVSSAQRNVKDLFTIRTIDAYAEKLMTYTQDFLNRLDKLGVHWLVCHLPAGVNFYSDEMAYVFSAPFIVKSEWALSHAKQIKRKGKDKTFMMYSIRQEKPYNCFLIGSNEEKDSFNEEKEKDSKVELEYIIRGILVRKSIFAELLQE